MKLHGRLFIDVVQTAVELDGKPSERQITFPGHMFGRISIDGDTLRMSFLDDEWVGRAIAAGAVSIDSEDEDHQPRVLTATTAELQKFVVDHADDDQAFSFDVDDLKRKGSESEMSGGAQTFPVTGVIKGWTEALQQMPVWIEVGIIYSVGAGVWAEWKGPDRTELDAPGANAAASAGAVRLRRRHRRSPAESGFLR